MITGVADHPRSRGVYSSTPRTGTESQDHPRSRGVYDLLKRFPAGTDGSSPLARGLPEDGQDREGPARIIPARAGFTTAGTLGGGRCGDHPRSRGVYHM